MINWQPISTAPDEKEILIGKWVNDDEWYCCISSRCYDPGDYYNEEGYWYWTNDYDGRLITDLENGPTHWAELTPPAKEPSP